MEWDKRSLGFLAVVVAIIGGISMMQLQIGQMKARDAQRKADVELVARAVDAYFVDHDEYPRGADGLILACGGKVPRACEWGGENLEDEHGTVYLRKFPVEPHSQLGRKYVYEVNETGQKYRIYVALEYTRDPAYKSDLTVMCGENIQCNWYVSND